MLFSNVNRFCLLAVFSVAAPTLCLPAAISVTADNTTTTCEVGTCSAPGTLAAGGSTSGASNFTYTFGDGDQYFVTTSYGANNGPHMSFTVNAVYTGNNGNAAAHSVANDLLAVDFLQNFAYTGPATSSGSFNATLVQFGNAAGSYTEADLYFDGNSIGVAGPYFGPGTESVSKGPTTLNGLGNPLAGDFRYTEYFAANTAPVPEPSTVALLLFVVPLLIFATLWHRLKRAQG